MNTFNCKKINSSLSDLKEVLNPRIAYMDSVSNDIRSLEMALKSYSAVMKPLSYYIDRYEEDERIYFEYLEWSAVKNRLMFVREELANDMFTKCVESPLMETPFEIREKAHKLLSEFLEAIKNKNSE